MIRIKDELEFHNWFKRNYRKLGFDKLISYNKNFPDFTMIKNDEEINVELETKTSNFILHRHNPRKVDFVVSIIEDIKLKVPVVLIKNIRLVEWNEKETLYDLKTWIYKLFKHNKVLTSSEISKKLKIHWNTAEKYLLEIVIDGKIEKIKKLGVNLWMLK